MSIPGALSFSIYVDWFNAHGKSTRLASIGPIMLICLNLPPSERLKPENVYDARTILGPKEPTALQLNYLLMPLIKELKELWQGYHLSPTSTGPSGSFIHVAILTAIADVVAMCKLTGFISHPGIHFCNFCTIQKAQIEEIGPQFHYTRSYQNHKSTIAKWLRATPQQRQEIFSEYGVRYSILEDLPYWEATRMVNLDIMHNLILEILKDHATFKLCIPESKSRIYFRSHRKYNDTNSSDSDSMTSNSSLDKITLREAHSLRRDAEKIINEALPTTSTQKTYHPMPTPHMQHPSGGSEEIPSFDADYIPTSEIPSELDISALSDHQIKGEALEHLPQIMFDTIIPSSWTRVPHKMGSPSSGNLKAAEWALLYKVYIPFSMLTQQMLSDEHKYTNTQRNMGQSEETENELTKNTFHLINAIKIGTKGTVSMDDATAFAEHCKKFCLSNQHLFPKQKSKPNHHFADHIPKIFQHWGPAQASATWGYELVI
ncbi:hypothetical protein O181_008382 [Austropuccinia psidii MF-1]|uniref:Uncharacterized protein n=1 Tax=Austropuccinia psidii MF-1 TaxID=1389203 RepID=A0A9Q3BNP2_9BASI|nr:hypothetical protein [Austropuccinia psidii MF-1]